MTEFAQKVYGVVKAIPRGKVMTYQEVAQAAGRPRAYRAVGTILGKNYDLAIPCHRVVGSNGRTGGYNRGVQQKIERLKSEGVSFYQNSKLKQIYD